MRKLSLFVCSGLVLLGMFGLQAQVASAVELEPDCGTYGLPNGLNGFHVANAPDISKGGDIADLYGGGAICGNSSDTSGTHTKTIYILTAGSTTTKAGPTVRCANPANPQTLNARQTKGYCVGSDLDYRNDKGIGAFVGQTQEDLELCGIFFCSFLHSTSNQQVNAVEGLFGIGVHANPNCVPETVVQCFAATDDAGTGVSFIEVEPCWGVSSARCNGAKPPDPLDPQGDKYIMTIHDIQFEPIGQAYYLKIGQGTYDKHSEPGAADMHVCGRANPNPDARTCGKSPDNDADWVNKNGPAGTYKCSPKVEGYGARAINTKTPNWPDACKAITWTP